MKFRGFELIAVDTYFSFKEVTAPSSTPTNQVRVYAKDKSGTSALYLLDDAGDEREIAPPDIVTGTGTANRVAYWSSTSTIAANAALTTGRITFADANGLPTDDGSLFWDNSNKRFGIGISASLLSAFHMQVSSGEAFTADYYAGATNLRLRRANNTAGSPTQVVANDALGRISGLGYHSGGAFGSATARFEMSAAEDFTATNQGTFLSLYTTPTGSTTIAERFRIGPAGQLGIGGATYGTAGYLFVSGGASAAPSWTAVSSAIDHGSIGGLTDDDHTGYVRITGRTGTSNDFVLSTTTNGTVYGSSASGGWLILTGTSHATAGLLVFGSSQYMDQATTTFVFGPTISNATANFVYYNISPVYTGSGSGFQGAKFAPVIRPSASVAAAYGFLGQTSFGPGSGVTVTTAVSSFAQLAYENVTGAVTTGITHYVVAPSIAGSLKPSTQYGVYVENQGAAGISTAIGLAIIAQSGATTNIDLLTPSVTGSQSASGTLTLNSTSNATKGDITLSCADLTHLSTSRLRMASQNRVRYLNSIAEARDSSGVSLNDNTVTVISMDAENIDTDGIHDTVTNNSRLTCQLAGKYYVYALLTYTANATGIRQARLKKTGTVSLINTQPGLSGFETRVYIGGVQTLTTSDYMEVEGYQNSGGSLSLIADASVIGMYYIGE